jgi:hypothetical protein
MLEFLLMPLLGRNHRTQVLRILVAGINLKGVLSNRRRLRESTFAGQRGG